ncbi:hypothetical protein HDV01_004806 [Terramyces sp. JEL0728]|nr:hypothetical protein HDV01_004806 [Terramyces sp. JEL0728]
MEKFRKRHSPFTLNDKMDLKSILLAFVLVLGFLIIIIAVYGFYAVYGRSAIISPIFKILVTSLLVLVFLQSIISLLNTFVITSWYLARILGIVLYLVIFTITLLNIQILEIFSVLNDRITPKFIAALRIFTVAWHIILLIPNYATLFYGESLPTWINLTNSFGGVLYVISCAMYDNAQGIFLIVTIYRSKQKSNQMISHKSMECLKNTVVTNLIILVLDWATFALYSSEIYKFISGAELKDTDYLIVQICEFISCLHATCMIFVIKMLKDFTFADKKIAKKQTPVEKQNDDTMQIEQRNSSLPVTLATE